MITNNKNIIVINSNDELNNIITSNDKLNKRINEFSDVLGNSINEVSISCANPYTFPLNVNKPTKL